MSKLKEALTKEKTKEGLPKEAFAIVEDPDDPSTWKLPHHTKAILRVQASEEDIIKAARHLAAHYERADKSVPDTLGALI
jgi:hypothetical protein